MTQPAMNVRQLIKWGLHAVRTHGELKILSGCILTGCSVAIFAMGYTLTQSGDIDINRGKRTPSHELYGLGSKQNFIVANKDMLTQHDEELAKLRREIGTAKIHS